MKEFIQYMRSISLIILILVLFTMYGYQIARVPSSSMEPTIAKGSFILIQKIGNEYDRGDIVAFYPPRSLNDSSYYVKRIIGLPNDVIEVKNHILYRNGEKVEDFPMQYNLKKIRVPDHHYFVLGDNRDHSFDSHVWGYLNKENVIGEVIRIF